MNKYSNNNKYNKNELIVSDNINTLKESKVFIKILINRNGSELKDIANLDIYVVENENDFLELLFFLQKNKKLLKFN